MDSKNTLLPPLPRTASPVPALTSIHATDGRVPCTTFA